MNLNPKTLTFLAILLIRNIKKLEFKVYRKPSSKNDHIHFYSYHNNTKGDIIIGFYLRAQRIGSPKYFNDEFNHIENSFLNLQWLSSQEMNTAIRVQNLDETDCISHSTNTLEKDMNPIILPPAMVKWLGRQGSSALVRQLVQEKEKNSEFKPVKFRLKIDLV